MSDDTDPPEVPSSGPLPSAPGPANLSILLEDGLKASYLDYAMSTITSRAIPDLRDGLKPVHRRILYCMSKANNFHDEPYRKSAHVVGDVLGRYHPHGDAPIYDALVRLAQNFSMSMPLVDGQGNFGSIDGDNPSAMRYTDVRLAKIADELLQDLGKNTVQFKTNYSNEFEEPVVLPARFPNLLVNGAQGIAVGMATSFPPHNLGEVIDATVALVRDPDLALSDLMEFIHGPDFPTGGVILGQASAREAYQTGRGSITVRAKTRFEKIGQDRIAIVLDEVPYQVNKANLERRIVELVQEKKIEGVAQIRDETNRDGVRMVIELKRDAVAEEVLSQLFRLTTMQVTIAINFVALNNDRPEQMSLRDLICSFIAFREQVIFKRTTCELDSARERMHVLCGLAVAIENFNEVIGILRAAGNLATAKQNLKARSWSAKNIYAKFGQRDPFLDGSNSSGSYWLSETQTKAIFDLNLERLVALTSEEINDEQAVLADEIDHYLDILTSPERIQTIIVQELLAVREEFAIPRRTVIVNESSSIGLSDDRGPAHDIEASGNSVSQSETRNSGMPNLRSSEKTSPQAPIDKILQDLKASARSSNSNEDQDVDLVEQYEEKFAEELRKSKKIIEELNQSSRRLKEISVRIIEGV